MSLFGTLPVSARFFCDLGAIRSSIVVLLAFIFTSSSVSADDVELVKQLKTKGIEFKESKGIITALSVSDGSKLTEDDFQQMGRLTSLKMMTLSNCMNDKQLARLTSLSSLEYLQTNLAGVTDEGIKPLAQFKNLKTLKFFHPGKSFSGAGLAQLAELPNLQSLTVAGSLAFNDDGMAAVAKLTGLKEFRTWHAGSTDEGVKKLKSLKNLKSLYLGQRLTYMIPASPSDKTIGILAEMKSLESLQLDEARLSFDSLQQLKQLPGLKKLTLGGIDISKEEVERLKRELPQVKIEWTEPTEAYQKRIKALFGSCNAPL
jgi:hypothetical protein